MDRDDRAAWRKSTYSGTNGGNCVELADKVGRVLVCDTKDNERGLVMSFTGDAWHTFLSTIKRLGPDKPTALAPAYGALGLLCWSAA